MSRYKVLKDNIKNVVAQEFEKTIPIITEEYEAKIHRQAEEITRLLAENEKLKKDLEYYHTGTDTCDMESARIAGQNEAWKLAKKIVGEVRDDGYSAEELRQIFGYPVSQPCIMENTYQKAAEKVAEWEKAKEEIKVGDIIRSNEDSGFYALVVNIDKETQTAFLITENRSLTFLKLDQCFKTGHHIDIDSFLNQIGGKEK